MQKAYKDIYTDVYRIHAKYGRIDTDKRNDAYWEGLIKEVGNYWQELLKGVESYSEASRYNFASDLLVAMMNELERQGMMNEIERQGSGDSGNG